MSYEEVKRFWTQPSKPVESRQMACTGMMIPRLSPQDWIAYLNEKNKLLQDGQVKEPDVTSNDKKCVDVDEWMREQDRKSVLGLRLRRSELANVW